MVAKIDQRSQHAAWVFVRHATYKLIIGLKLSKYTMVLA